MNKAMSQRVGRAMGKARPTPTIAERRRVQKAMQGMDRWRDVPLWARQLVARWERTAG